MIEKHLDIETRDGAMNSFVVYPEENGPHPVVLFYMDAPGKREELHDMARRLASVGYYVVLPNLYYRRSHDYWLKERTEPAMAVMFEHMHSLTNALVTQDTQALLRHVDETSATVWVETDGPCEVTVLSARCRTFEVAGHLIWGLTAHLLDGVLDLAGWQRPWDAERRFDIPPRYLTDRAHGRGHDAH